MPTSNNTFHTASEMSGNNDYETLIRQMEQRHRFLLSQVSHEIRNPVTLINSFLQLLENRYPELTKDSYWQKITENMQFLISLLNELSAFNNSEKLVAQTVNLHSIFHEVVESVTPVLSEHNISINLCKNSPVPVIQADGLKIRQLLLNLIRNSADAIETDGNISCSIWSDGASVFMTISDNGPGIPEDYQKNLFEPFVTHKKEGTGLGLPICKRIAEAHNGSISFTSTSQTGTTFSITLPVS